MSPRTGAAEEPAVRAGHEPPPNRYGLAMTSDPRAALDRLVAALEAHLQAASRRSGEADPAVVSAYQTLADAFETYDEALYAAYDEVTPFVLYEDADDADDLDDDDEDDDEDDDLEDGDDLDDDLDDDLEVDLADRTADTVDTNGAGAGAGGQKRSG
jgi:hypothetical protein